MQPETFGFDKWSTRRAAVRMGSGLWVAGFVVAGAAAWQMHHASSARAEATQTETSARIPATPGARCEVATKDGQDTDVAENASVIHAPESEGAMVMPEGIIRRIRDVRVVVRPPRRDGFERDFWRNLLLAEAALVQLRHPRPNAASEKRLVVDRAGGACPKDADCLEQTTLARTIRSNEYVHLAEVDVDIFERLEVLHRDGRQVFGSVARLGAGVAGW
jgi:hypothetical protein